MRVASAKVLFPSNFFTWIFVNAIPTPIPLYNLNIIPPAYLPVIGNVLDNELITEIPGIDPLHSNESDSSCHTNIGMCPVRLRSLAAA